MILILLKGELFHAPLLEVYKMWLILITYLISTFSIFFDFKIKCIFFSNHFLRSKTAFQDVRSKYPSNMLGWI
ncbi:hypothetical protein MCERE19_00222 [Spirosomataceae bacterium]